MFTQSLNWPDTNILDLGFFRAIQSFNDDCPANEEELIKSVEKAYGEYPYRKLNSVWLTLQSCLNMIIENDGGNDYKILHMGKESMERRGLLPPVLDVTPAATAWLNPMMDDNSTLDADNLDDGANVPMNTATPTIEIDGEEGENATSDEIMNTGVLIILFRQNTHPAHVTMGRVGATAIRSTRRCRWFLFCFCFSFVSFDCCISLLSAFHPSWRL